MKSVIRLLGIFVVVYFLINFLFKLLGAGRNKNSHTQKRTESGNRNINIDIKPKEQNRKSSGDYIDFEDVTSTE